MLTNSPLWVALAVVANAGISLWSAAESTDDKAMQKLFEVNAYGPYYLFREYFNLIGEANLKGRIGVVVSSISGKIVNVPQKFVPFPLMSKTPD